MIKHIVLLSFVTLLAGQLRGQVNGEGDDTIAYSIALDDFVITAQYRPTHYKKAVHQVSVIDEKSIRDHAATRLDEILKTNAAVRLEEDNVFGSQLRMRGQSASNVAVLVDGVPVIGRLDGALDISQLSLQSIKRIEMVEGPMSNYYGNNAAGGVINLITQKSQLNVWSGEVKLKYETIGLTDISMGLSHQMGKWRIGLSGRYTDYDQYAVDSLRLVDTYTRENGSNYTLSRYPWNPKEQYGGGVSATFRPDENNNLTLKYDYNKEEVGDFGTVRRPQFDPYSNDAFYMTRRNDVAFLYKGILRDKYYVDFTLANNQYDRVVDEKRYYIETGSFDDELQSSDSLNFDSWFSRLTVSKQLNPHLDLSVGFNYKREQGMGDRILVPGTSDSTRAILHEKAIYTDLKYTWSDFQLGLSARLTDNSSYDMHLTPAVVARYSLDKAWTLRGSYAHGYRSPSLKELYIEFIDINHHILGNTELKPENSKDVQLSLDYDDDGAFTFGINMYQTIVSDRIAWFEFDQLKYRYENVNEYNTTGIKGKLGVGYGPIRYSGSGSLSRWKVNLVTGDGSHTGNVFDMYHNLIVGTKDKLSSLMVNYRYIGSQPVFGEESDQAILKKQEANHFVDVSVGRFFLDKKINIRIGVKNITDTRLANISGTSTSIMHSDKEFRNTSRGRSLFVQGVYRL